MPHDILTVAELNAFIKDVVTAGFPSSFWVCGEIQNLDRYKSKSHLFFELVEKESGGKDIKAKIGVAIWAGIRPKIEALLKRAENAFELKDGIEVKFSGKIDFYPPYGTLRFIVDNIDPVYTLGKIAQDRQKLIAELTAAGTLARNKAVSFPVLPLSIGVITAFDSAAYHDVIDQLKQSGYAFSVRTVNAVMQGKNCEASVVNGLRQLNAMDGLDVIVITRGGGSIADLSAFDAKGIALAIAGSRYPVLTGIGHEINTSIADLAAHTFAKTPTAAAQLLIEKIHAAVDILDNKTEGLIRSATEALSSRKEYLRRKAGALQTMTMALFNVQKEHQARLGERVRQAPHRVLTRQREDVISLEGTLKKSLQLRLREARTKMDHLEKFILMSSPARTLQRGFSITRRADGALIRSAAGLTPGETIITEVVDGTITSTI